MTRMIGSSHGLPESAGGPPRPGRGASRRAAQAPSLRRLPVSLSLMVRVTVLQACIRVLTRDPCGMGPTRRDGWGSSPSLRVTIWNPP